MNKITRTNLDNLWSEDRDLQNKAFSILLRRQTDQLTGLMMCGLRLWKT